MCKQGTGVNDHLANTFIPLLNNAGTAATGLSIHAIDCSLPATANVIVLNFVHSCR